MPKIRLLLNSYSPCTGTSYGSITRKLGERLHRTGEFDIAGVGMFHRPALDPVPWKVIPTLTVTGDDGNAAGFDKRDQWGQLSLSRIVQQVKPDIILSIADAYMVRHVQPIANRHDVKHVLWTLAPGDPVDENDLPVLGGVDHLVAMTDYAADLWERLLGRKVSRTYLGVDLDVFKPLSAEERLRYRHLHTQGNVKPEDFLLLYVGRNQDRKRPWLCFEILHYLTTPGSWGWIDGVPVLAPWDPNTQRQGEISNADGLLEVAKPIPARLWMHSAMQEGRWDFRVLMKHWGLREQEHVFFTRGLSDATPLGEEDVATLYQMSDAVSMVTGTEGFGVPIVEGAAVGIPSVYTDYSGCAEVGKRCLGYPVPPQSFHPAAGSHNRVANPNVAEAVYAFYRAYENRGLVAQDRIAAVRKHYDWNKIALQWTNHLRELHKTPKTTAMGVTV